MRMGFSSKAICICIRVGDVDIDIDIATQGGLNESLRRLYMREGGWSFMKD